jgi:raffinose/stachyose/melibiose transport system substrate-binding protein
MMRRWLALLLALVFIAALTPTGARGQQSNTLSFWSWRSEDKAAYDRMIKVFEQRNPGIKIEFTPFRQTEYNTILSSALTAGKGPDIIHLRAYGGLEQFAAPGFLAALDDKVPELKRFPLQTMVGARARKDGKIYGVPFATQTLVVFYNKKIFRDAGVPFPKAPWTWDDYVATAKKLTNKEKGIYGSYFNLEWEYYYYFIARKRGVPA